MLITVIPRPQLERRQLRYTCRVLLNPQHPLGTLWGTEVQDVLYESGILDTEPVCQRKGKTRGKFGVNFPKLGAFPVRGFWRQRWDFGVLQLLMEFIVLYRQRSNPAHLTEC